MDSQNAQSKTADLKSRLMARIQNELRVADQSELHSYDKNQTAHSRYVKA